MFDVAKVRTTRPSVLWSVVLEASVSDENVSVKYLPDGSTEAMWVPALEVRRSNSEPSSLTRKKWLSRALFA